MKTIILFIIMALFSGCSQGGEQAGQISQKTKTEKHEQISCFITEILDTSPARVNNLILCAKSIDGKIILPDEQFSFNETVGERTMQKGYREAKIIIDGKSGYGIGGGVCQISSTLYNAALFAELEILERHDHEGNVLYIERGRDAAVCYNSQDLKFKNTLTKPVKISVKVENSQVEVIIFALG